jgi:hypothetical protein
VSHSDQRLIGDIEKLIKTKIELEPMEFEEDQPRGRINDGRRAWGGDDPRDAIDEQAVRAAREGRERREPRAPREASRDFSRPAPASKDPFFDKPYEAPAEASPAWEKTAATVAPKGLSAYIKPKRKVAALFKAEQPKVEQPAEQPVEQS